MRKRRKHRIRNTIGIVLLLILLVTVVRNVAEYYRLKKTAERYLNSTGSVHVEEPVDLVGLLDSYGVPYSPSVEKSFMRYLEEDLASQGMLASSLDLYGLYINKTWEVDGIFQNNVTIGEMKTMQNFGMDFVRHKYGKERIREDLVYTCDKKLEDITVASYYSNLERPIVLYSCAANDLFYYFGTSLESLSPSKIFKIIQNFGNGLSLLNNEIKSNLETLTTYNPKAVIMVMGLYVPSDNIFLQRAGSIVIDQINGTIADACEEYPNAMYVDVSCLSFAVLEGDFHPSGEGQKIIKSILSSETISGTFDMELGFSVDKEFGQELTTELPLLDLSAVKQWIEGFPKLNLDYVEWAVLIELFLEDRGLGKIQFNQLAKLERTLKNESFEEGIMGIDILMIERKVHKLFDLNNYSINPNRKNDKLNLLSYMSFEWNT